MKRLTLEELNSFVIAGSIREGKTIIAKALTELKEYKKIEEELGCPIEVVLKALEQGYIYSNIFCENEYVKWEITHITKDKDFGYCLQSVNGFSCGLAVNRDKQYVLIHSEIFKLKNYKIDWFLKEDKSK